MNDIIDNDPALTEQPPMRLTFERAPNGHYFAYEETNIGPFYRRAVIGLDLVPEYYEGMGYPNRLEVTIRPK